MRTLTLVVLVYLSLEWNTYLVFNSDIVNFVWKTNEGDADCIVLLASGVWFLFYLGLMHFANSKMNSIIAIVKLEILQKMWSSYIPKRTLILLQYIIPSYIHIIRAKFRIWMWATIWMYQVVGVSQTPKNIADR